jgi:hypothetical protein
MFQGWLTRGTVMPRASGWPTRSANRRSGP